MMSNDLLSRILSSDLCFPLVLCVLIFLVLIVLYSLFCYHMNSPAFSSATISLLFVAPCSPNLLLTFSAAKSTVRVATLVQKRALLPLALHSLFCFHII